MCFVALEAGYFAVVLYADDKLSSREVGKGDNMLRYLIGVLACALSIEVLIFFSVANTCGL